MAMSVFEDMVVHEPILVPLRLPLFRTQSLVSVVVVVEVVLCADESSRPSRPTTAIGYKILYGCLNCHHNCTLLLEQVALATLNFYRPQVESLLECRAPSGGCDGRRAPFSRIPNSQWNSPLGKRLSTMSTPCLEGQIVQY